MKATSQTVEIEPAKPAVTEQFIQLSLTLEEAKLLHALVGHLGGGGPDNNFAMGPFKNDIIWTAVTSRRPNFHGISSISSVYVDISKLRSVMATPLYRVLSDVLEPENPPAKRAERPCDIK